MPSFRLSTSSIRRLNSRFKRYTRVRRLIHENMKSYIEDFMNFTGTQKERKEFLEDKYRRLAPSENYLVFRNDSGRVLFNAEEIALIMGRAPSSISRTLGNILNSEGWCSKLLAIRENSKSGNNNTIFVYDSKIFDLIMDYRESRYLERYKLHGSSDYKEVLRYWDYLKKLEGLKTDSSKNRIIEDDSDLQELILPELPNMSWHDVLKLIGAKLFTIRADMIFVLVFGLCFMLARKWPSLIPAFVGMSLASLIACMLMLRKRASGSELISDLGAVSTLLVLFWGMNLTIENAIYTPGGSILTLKEHEPLITLSPVRLSGAKRLGFWLNSENQDSIKEIFYKFDSQREYKSTGFTWSGSPNFLLEPDRQHGLININLKYRDSENHEHEPLAFAFDADREYFNAGKNLLLNEKDFVMINKFGKLTKINAIVNDSVSEIVYGINTSEPDKVFRPGQFDSGKPLSSENILTIQDKQVYYVSAYIIFRDGTSSDVRVTKTPPSV